MRQRRQPEPEREEPDGEKAEDLRTPARLGWGRPQPAADDRPQAQVPPTSGALRRMKKGQKTPQAVKQAFLDVLRHTGNITAAATVLGMNRDTYYEWVKKDPTFRAAAEDAMDEGIDRLLIEVRRRAVDGVDEPVGFYKGKPGAFVKRYSDNLLMFLVKARRPEYRDNYRGELHGHMGGPPDGNPDLGRKLLDEMDEEALGDD